MLRWQTGVCACSRASPLCPQNITNVVIDMSHFCSASSNSQLALLAQWWPSARGSIVPGESNVRSASGNPYWNISVHDVLTRRSHICAALALAGVSVAEAGGASCLGRISECVVRMQRTLTATEECARFILSVRKRTWIDLAGRGPSVSERGRARTVSMPETGQNLRVPPSTPSPV